MLFYRFLRDNLVDLLPVVYTPTVGDACQEFSRIYRRPHGLFITYPERDRMATALAAAPADIDVIVLTDGERILGLGDQGLGGMAIPIGKLSLYTAVGGIDPSRTLPVLLDVGTNNPLIRDDPLYLGWRHDRVTGDDYDRFVADFVDAVKARWPRVLLQWEDFAQHHATSLLHAHRSRILSFNDDIQGTAAVALATVHATLDATNTGLDHARVVIVGAGSAGSGIARMLVDAGVDRARAVPGRRRRFAARPSVRSRRVPGPVRATMGCRRGVGRLRWLHEPRDHGRRGRTTRVDRRVRPTGVVR